jgi:hypothetical protein
MPIGSFAQTELSHGDPSTIRILNRRDADGWLDHDLFETARHELGHHFGCRIDMAPGHWMSGHDNQSSEITVEDMHCVDL